MSLKCSAKRKRLQTFTFLSLCLIGKKQAHLIGCGGGPGMRTALWFQLYVRSLISISNYSRETLQQNKKLIHHDWKLYISKSWL